jgi:hypothetical protein
MIFEVIHIRDILINNVIYFNFENKTSFTDGNAEIFRLAARYLIRDPLKLGMTSRPSRCVGPRQPGLLIMYST